MCGIAGILGRIDDRNRAALGRMAAAMAHRGPDGEGMWISQPDEEGRGCLLAHRRLSILDLSHAADQPMIDPVTGHVIVFNGEIYNFQDIRRDLEAAGQTFTSTGDTAVMLRALATQGADAAAKLRGMFAFALWDPRARTLTVARDPLGIKPLYICHSSEPGGDWSFIFASEVRAVLASGLLGKPRLNPTAVKSAVWNGFVVGPDTIVAGVRSLPAGELQVLGERGETRTSRTFWHMPTGDTPKNVDAAGLAASLRDSVRLHMLSDVPLGVFLSGGVDSSAVANLAQQCSDRPINTFTLAFEEKHLNEGEYARAIAGAIGSQHRETVLTESRFVGALERAFATLDQPTFDGLNSYYMSQAVRDAGLTVALVGTGGDELFGGYTSFRHLPRLRRFARAMRFVPRAVTAGGARLVAAALAGRPRGSAVAPQTRWAKLPDMIRRSDDALAVYQLAYGLFLPDFHRDLLAGHHNGDLAGYSGLPPAMTDRLRRETAGHSPLSAISIMELRCFLGERLLRDSDAASMAASIEMRLPLVDQVLVEQVSRVPDDRRYRPLGRKALLREIGLAGLDPKLFDRPKSGFVLPFDTWIRKSLGHAMDDTMRDASLAAAIGLRGDTVARLWQSYQDGARGMYWSRVWAIYVLIRWCHQHGVLL